MLEKAIVHNTLSQFYSKREQILSLILINVNFENLFNFINKPFLLFHFDENIPMIAPDHAHVSMFENTVEKIRALHAPSFYPLNLTHRSVTPELRALRPPLRALSTRFMNCTL